MPRWLGMSPFMKQCFVTTGVSINISGAAAVMAFTTGMLPQLRQPSSGMEVDDSTATWIAATPPMWLLIGNFMTPTLMTSFGRKMANLISISTLIIGWILLIFADNVIIVIVARSLQGVSMGMALNLGPILIGEYTSPKNRGAFLMFMSVLTAVWVIQSHAIGSYFSWGVNAVVCLLVSLVCLVITLFSPESPAWLANSGRYDDCKKAFRWLRGNDEEEELKEILEAGELNDSRSQKTTVLSKVRDNFRYIKSNAKNREFYMPIFIMIHMYALSMWGGINVLATYTNDVFENIIGKDNDISAHVVAIDVQRMVSSVLAIFIIRRVKRRVILFSITGLGIMVMLVIAGYTYCKSKDMLYYDHPFIGMALIHIHMFTIASCTISLPYIIAGEIFPLRHKGVAGGISIISFSVNFSIVVKLTPFLFKTIGVYGAYVLYAGIVAYSLLIVMIFLPETKDRTLQDIEREFRDKLSTDDLKSVQPLTGRLVDTSKKLPVQNKTHVVLNEINKVESLVSFKQYLDKHNNCF